MKYVNFIYNQGLIKKKFMTQNTQEILDAIIDAGRKELIKNPELSKEEFHKIKNDIYKGYDIPKPFPSIRILERYDERVNL